MIKTLQKIMKQDKEKFIVPKGVQQAIPIRTIWPDGIFRVGNKFSKTFRFEDINYAVASKRIRKRCSCAIQSCSTPLTAGRLPKSLLITDA